GSPTRPSVRPGEGVRYPRAAQPAFDALAVVPGYHREHLLLQRVRLRFPGRVARIATADRVQKLVEETGLHIDPGVSGEREGQRRTRGVVRSDTHGPDHVMERRTEEIRLHLLAF